MQLTKPQKLILDMSRYSQDPSATGCGSVIFNYRIPIDQMQRTVNELYRINDALRTRIIEKEGRVEQFFEEYHYEKIEVLEFVNEQEFHQYAEAKVKETFDLFESLCDIKICVFEDKSAFLIKIHHIISDAWTMSVLASQLCFILKGETPQVFSYADYIQSEQKYLCSNKYLKDKLFWEEQLLKCDEPLYLSDHMDKNLHTEWCVFELDNTFQQNLINYADYNHTSLFNLILTALSIYLSRIKNNAESFFLGTAVINRTSFSEKNTVGMFINTVPIPIHLNYNVSFADNLDEIGNTCFDVFRHQKFNYGDIIRDSREKNIFNGKLYDVLISYQNAQLRINDTDWTSKWYHCVAQNETLQIHIEDRNNDGILKVHYGYHSEAITAFQIHRMHHHIMCILEDAIKCSHKKISELQMLTDVEISRIIFDFNNTDVSYPFDKCVHELFEEQVKNIPERTAVIACDKQMTYYELNRESNRIANWLVDNGISKGDIVALQLHRKSYLLSSIYGVLKSGAAYLPIDPSYPKERIEYILNDSKAKFVITDDNVQILLNNKKDNSPNIAVSPSDLCYIIYTSGSTGNPKGVMIRHRNVVNYAHSNNNNNLVVSSYIAPKCETMVSVTNYVFDIFVTETILILLNGKTIIFADEKQATSQEELVKLLKEHPADSIQTTPTKMKMLTSNPNNSFLSKFKVIILGGEVFDKRLYNKLRSYTDAEIINIYGPSETTVWSSIKPINTDDITIGKPVANTQIYILDNYQKPVPINVVGELCIAGDGVCAGYLNRPELTSQSFINNPFGKGKLYKTGDLAYWREDGNIAYVGRNDFQVKIRGLRIELGEIENAISSIDGIVQAVVVVRKDSTQRQLICAFYSGKEFEPQFIRNHIGAMLPKYMLPHIFYYLDSIPVTPSGKVNRKALPEIDFSSISTYTDYQPPTTALEKKLCEIIGNTLNFSRVGIDNDFFDLGLDSLKAIEFISKARSANIYFGLQDVFDAPTVRTLCKKVIGDKKPVNTQIDSGTDYDTLHKLLNDSYHIKPLANKKSLGNIIITGTTGFLGVHILTEYINDEKGIAYCIVRGDAASRLNSTLEYYFGDKYTSEIGKRIIPISADITEFDKADIKLSVKIDTVINAAANVKHYGNYSDFESVNVYGTMQMLKLAKKHNAHFVQISTTSVSGNSETFFDDHRRIVFNEEKLYINQVIENVYVKSKFEAECAILKEVSAGEISATIIRVGNLTNRFSDLKFQPNFESNAFLRRLKAIIGIKAIPEYLKDYPCEFSPVDKTAEALIKALQYSNNSKVLFHVYNNNTISLEQLVFGLSEFEIKLKILSRTEFERLLYNASDDKPLMNFYDAFVGELDKNGNIKVASNIVLENSMTNEFLSKSGFNWENVPIDYIKRYIQYFFQ